VTWTLIIDEYEGQKDGSTVEAESFAEIEGIIRTLTSNRDTGFRRAVTGRVMQGDRKWFDVRWAPTTKTHWIEYCPPERKR
jgi:hypothetical protein